MKNNKITIIFLAFVLVLGGCSKKAENNYHKSDRCNAQNTFIVDSNKELVKVKEIDTPYTECFQNEDGTYSLYIYSSPIQYYDGSSYRHIDNTIIESTNSNYVYENKDNSVKTYFPKNLNYDILITNGDFSLPFNIGLSDLAFSEADLVDYNNIYGERIKAVVYKSDKASIYLYSSYYGVEIETVYHSDYKIAPQIVTYYHNDFPNHYDNANNGYIALRKGTDFNDIEAIIHSPISFENDNYVPVLEAEVSDFVDKKRITYNIDEATTVINQSIVLYTSNMPDSCAYSKFDKNQYLSRFSYIGNSELLGEGLDYIRFRLDYYMKIDPEKVINTSYNFKSLSNGDISKYKFKENLGQWSSSHLSWKMRNKDFCDINTTINNSIEGYVSVDISDYTRKCLLDDSWMTESYGVLMTFSGDYQIVSSSDNPLFPPFLCINISELPSEFHLIDDINPK